MYSKSVSINLSVRADKVIEDLDKFANGDICISCPKCRYVDEDNIECENCGALGALEIVKRGGLS